MRLSRFLSVLAEARMEPSLFHWLGQHEILAALKRGSFLLGVAAAGGADGQFQKGRFFYLSMARSPASRFIHGYKFGTIIEFNKDWLKARYKIVPVNYWAGMTSGAIPDSEQEDRLISHKPTLPIPSNASDMIRAIHVTLRDERDAKHFGMGTERDLIITCKRMGIPVRLYDQKNMSLPSQETTLGSVKDRLMHTTDHEPYRRFRSLDDFDPYIELLYAKSKDQLSEKAKKLMWKVVGYYRHDAIATLDADIHNARSTNRPAVHKIALTFQKFGIKSAKEYVNFVDHRWKMILDAEEKARKTDNSSAG